MSLSRGIYGEKKEVLHLQADATSLADLKAETVRKKADDLLYNMSLINAVENEITTFLSSFWRVKIRNETFRSRRLLHESNISSFNLKKGIPHTDHNFPLENCTVLYITVLYTIQHSWVLPDLLYIFDTISTLWNEILLSKQVPIIIDFLLL